MADNPELEVIEVIQRGPHYYGKENKLLQSSGGTYYLLNNVERSSVKHTSSDTWVCLMAKCKAYYDGTPNGKGCEHTRCAMSYAKKYDHVPVD